MKSRHGSILQEFLYYRPINELLLKLTARLLFSRCFHSYYELNFSSRFSFLCTYYAHYSTFLRYFIALQLHTFSH